MDNGFDGELPLNARAPKIIPDSRIRNACAAAVWDLYIHTKQQ
jgi:hypothetical protein